MYKAIVTAADYSCFEDATLYTVTYRGNRCCDRNVRWEYLEQLRARDLIDPVVICCDRDGTEVDRIEV